MEKNERIHKTGNSLFTYSWDLGRHLIPVCSFLVWTLKINPIFFCAVDLQMSENLF